MGSKESILFKFKWGSYLLTATHYLAFALFFLIGFIRAVLVLEEILIDGWDMTNPNSSGYSYPAHEPNRGIDYIFGNNFDFTSCNLIDTQVSDHLPLFCDIEL